TLFRQTYLEDAQVAMAFLTSLAAAASATELTLPVKKMFGLPSMPSASALAASYRPLEAIFTWWKPWMTWMLSVLAPLGTVRPSTEMAPGWLGRPMWIETYGMSIRHEL